MSPRPRNTANKSLPQNLYYDARRGTYRYRRPTDGKFFPFGADRLKAIDAAKQLNLEFMRGADLIGAVIGNSSESFAGFLDAYERDVLPPRELAKGTLGLYAVHFRRFRKQFEGKAVDQITIRMIAEMLDALTPRTACFAGRHLQPCRRQGVVPRQPGCQHHQPDREETAQAAHDRGFENHPREVAGVAAKRNRLGLDHRPAPYRHP